MNVPYLIFIASGAVVCTALLAVLLKKKGMKAASAWPALFLCAALAFVCAKAGYVLIRFNWVWKKYGPEALLRFPHYEFSFFCGGAGAVLGAWLAARFTRQDGKRFLDAFAPCGALMVAFARAGEYFLEGANLPDSEIEPEFFHRFPFAVTNEYEEWYAALFMACAVCALAVFFLFLLRKKESAVAGLRLERVVFYLCLPQILLESLRNDSIYWGFVRAEQVLCAVTLFLLLLLSCLAEKEKGLFRTFWPLLADLACVGLMIFVEFNLDRGYVPIGPEGNYAVMAAALLGIAGCEIFCTRRRLKKIID